MTVYAAFNEFDGWGGFLGAIGSDLIATANANVALSGVNRAGVAMVCPNDHPSGGGVIGLSRVLEPLANGWLHMRVNRSAYTGGGSNATEFSQPAFRLTTDAGNVLVEFEYFASLNTQNSAGFRVYVMGSLVSGLTLLAPNSTADIDIAYFGHTTNGRIEIYIGGALEHTFTGNTLPGASTGLGTMRWWATGRGSATNETRIAHVVLADEPTVGARVYTIPFTGTGAVNDWAGTLSDITGTGLSDAVSVSADTDGDTLLATQAGIGAIGDGFRIAALVVSARAAHGSGADITQLAPLFRTAGGTILQGDPVDLDDIIGPRHLVMHEVPGAGRPFNEDDFASAQIGFRAIDP